MGKKNRVILLPILTFLVVLMKTSQRVLTKKDATSATENVP